MDREGSGLSVEQEQPAQSKNALAQAQQSLRISSVNNWRGQCLDNFARIEHAIIRCTEAILPHVKAHPFVLEEAARNRTRRLGEGLEGNWPKVQAATQLSSLLDHWSIRELERNDLVHGRFSIRASPDADWLLVNELLSVRKGVTITSRSTLDSHQAKAFLSAIRGERKRLEIAIDSFCQTVTKT